MELERISGTLTVVEFLQLEHNDDGDVLSQDCYFSIASRDGTQTVVAVDLIIEPGEYLQGLVPAGDD